MMRNTFALRLFLLSALGGAFAVAIAKAAEPPPRVALMNAGRSLLEWTLFVEPESTTLTLAGPQGHVSSFHFGRGVAPVLSLFNEHGAPLPDGSYTWEIRVTPRPGTDIIPIVQS